MAEVYTIPAHDYTGCVSVVTRRQVSCKCFYAVEMSNDPGLLMTLRLYSCAQVEQCYEQSMMQPGINRTDRAVHAVPSLPQGVYDAVDFDRKSGPFTQHATQHLRQ